LPEIAAESLSSITSAGIETTLPTSKIAALITLYSDML
jgi:hypothetical protein